MNISKKTFLHCMFCGKKCIISFFTRPDIDMVFINVKCDSCNEEYSTYRNSCFWLLSDMLKNPLNKKIFDCVFGRQKEVECEKQFLRQKKFIKENGLKVLEGLGNKVISKPKIFWE